MTGPATVQRTTDQEWKTGAACRKYDPELFFPPPSEITGAKLAKRICRSCPAISECLDEAIARKERHGVWGGLTPMERAFRRRKLAQSGEDA